MGSEQPSRASGRGLLSAADGGEPTALKKWQNSNKTKTLGFVASEVANANSSDVCLLIGAGCSFPSVPLAATIIDDIRAAYPEHCESLSESPSYMEVMGVLSTLQRKQRIGQDLAGAKVNTECLAIASLIAANKVTRVYTTNFDPLILQACAFIGKLPFVYDLAAYGGSQDALLQREDLATPCLVYLHGQQEGFVVATTAEETKAVTSKVERLWDFRKSTWIVAGYSGENDPLCEVFADQPEFPGRLFWFRHDEEPPCEAVATLIDEKAEAFIVYNASIQALARHHQIAAFPSTATRDPFKHMEARIAEFEEGTARLFALTRYQLLAAAENEKLREFQNLEALVQEGNVSGALNLPTVSLPESDVQSAIADLFAGLLPACETADQVTALAQRLEEMQPTPAVCAEVARSHYFAAQSTEADTDALLKRAAYWASLAEEELTGLEMLDLSRTKVTDAGLASLARLTGLQRLDLTGTQVTDAGLASLEGLTGLQELWLSGTKVTDAGLATLAGLTGLQLLSLEATRVTDAGLASMAGLTGLRQLILDGTLVTDAGLASLAGLSGLWTLFLGGTQVTDAGLASLAGLTGLQLLWLNGTLVTDAGLASLVGMTGLRLLFLNGTQVTDAGLASMVVCPALRRLYLRDTQVTDTGVAAFHAERKRLRLEAVEIHR